MIQHRNTVVMDTQGKEVIDSKKNMFNLTAIDSDVHQYSMGYIPSHWHKELEIFVLLEGSVTVQIENSTYELSAGDGCFINSEVLHAFLTDMPSVCHFHSFVFGSEIIGGMPGTVYDSNFVRPLIEKGASFLMFHQETDQPYFENFNKAFSACLSEEYGYEFDVRNALSNILLYVKSKSTQKENTITSIQEKRLKDMLRFIATHLAEPITVSEIAKSATICTRECQRIFNQYLHYSPTEYVLRKRIYNAAELLSDTDKSITEIALTCGFSTPSYFSKRFREFMKTTPNAYRLTLQNK